MKQMIISALLLFASVSVFAQNAKNDSIHEKFFNAKVRELTYRLDITDAQKSKFVAAYRRYNDEMRAVWAPKGVKPEAGKKVPEKPRTSADVANAQKRRMERQQQAQNVQMKYLDEFAKVLDAKQMSNFYEVEAKIQKKLMDRKKHPKGKFAPRPHKEGKPQGNQ